MTNKCLFGWIKRIFVSDSKSKSEKKAKRWRWVIAKLKGKQYPALTPPPQRTLSDAREEQRKHALTVALATAAAAEAAVAAAHAAAEVVRLTRNSTQSCHIWTHRDQNMAAVMIQCVFRGYLARKALRALKGLVRLQAIIRGRLVRRRTEITMKHLLSNVEFQLPAAAVRSCKADENKCLKPNEYLMTKEIKGQFECGSQRSWDCSMLLKDDAGAIWNKKQEATIKRARMLKYSFSHRERRNTQVLEDSTYQKENERNIFRLQQQRSDKEMRNKEGFRTLKPSVNPNLTTCDVHGSPHLKLRNLLQQDSLDALTLSLSFPRRSFTGTDESSIPNSPIFPAYMAATQSARAKARSMSMPKQRIGFYETYS